MPNIGGLFEPGLSEAQVKGRNDRQIARLDIPTVHYNVHRISDDGCAVALLDHGILENGDQPAQSSDGRYLALLDGEIYNGPELVKQYRYHSSKRDITDPLCCLLLYQEFGKQAFKKLNGLFVLIIYDTLKKQLTIVNDRMAFRPFFYLLRSNSLLFGSELKAITVIDSEKKVDELGVLQLFAYGQQAMDRTWLAGYKALIPGTVLQFDGRKFSKEQYWTYCYSESESALDQESYFTGYRYLMDRATERCMKGNRRIGIFLSGGYDSRVVAASIRDYHLPLPSFTFGETQSRDVRFAQQLASCLKLSHSNLQSNGSYLRNTCDAIVWRTEGLLPFANTTSIQFHETMHAAMDIVLVGLLGEFAGSHSWPRLLLARTRSQAINAIFSRYVLCRKSLVRRVFNPAFFDRMFSSLHDEFQNSFCDVQNEHPLNIADSWNFLNLHPRNSCQATSTDRHRFEMRAPHMDAELVDFLLRVPPRARIEQRIYKKMIAYGYPQIRSIPCTNSAKPINPRFLSEYGTMIFRFIGRELVKPLRHVLPVPYRLGREFRDLNSQMNSEPELAEDLLFPMLDEQIFPTEIFSTDGIREIIDEQYSGIADHALFISLIISWGLAAKFLLYDQVDQVPNGL